MKSKTTGLVLREVKVGESDRILTLLTPEGLVSASAKGSMRPKNKLFSASGLFCYSEFVLYQGKTICRVDEAAPIEVFFGLRQSVEALALATYIGELLQLLSPTAGEAAVLLRLALNTFYLLSENKKPPTLLKAVFELRSFSRSGFMPDVSACAHCDGTESSGYYLDIPNGMLLCADCGAPRGTLAPLNLSALAALRHILHAEDEQLFSFTLEGEAAKQLVRAAEGYILYHVDYPPKSLRFWKSLLPPEEGGTATQPENTV